MTSLQRTFSAALFVAALFAAPHAARAQGSQPRPESRLLAVEVVEGSQSRDTRYAVTESATGTGFIEFSPPRPKEARPEGSPPLPRVRLRASYEGDAVRIKVSAAFDDSYPADAPGPKFGPHEREAASLLAREGETVTVEELKPFGIGPLVLKVVRAEPRREPPPTPAPTRVVNRLKSVEVVSFSAAGAHLERGLLTVLNVSPKNIRALEVNVPDAGVSSAAQGRSSRPLMQPGGSYQMEITLGSSGRETPQGFVPNPPPEALVVGTVVFEDGSYEGDVKVAARLTATRRGRDVQLARVLKLLQTALEDSRQHSPAALAMFKVEVGALRIDPEPRLLDELLSSFPELPRDGGRKLVAEAALEGLRAGRVEAEYLLRRVEAESAADLRRQLESVREEIEKRGGARRD